MKIIIENTILGILFAGGIILAGSDGGLFPWINLAGVLMLGIVTILANIAHRRARGGNDGLYRPPS